MANETPLTITGNLTADPELRFLSNGTLMTSFTVASTPRNFHKQSNSWQNGETMFMRCIAWRQLAENIAESLTKGTRVIVQGHLTQRNWQTTNGETRSTLELTLESAGADLCHATVRVTKNPREDNNMGSYAPANATPPLSQGAWGESPANQASSDSGGSEQPPF